MMRAFFLHKLPQRLFGSYTVLVLCGLGFIGFLMTAHPGTGQADGDSILQGGGSDAAAPDSQQGEDREGTFVSVNGASDSRTGPNGEAEPVIKPNATIEMTLTPTGETLKTQSDDEGNFSFPEKNISSNEVDDIQAKFRIPICTWQYKYADTGTLGRTRNQETIRECVVDYVNAFTMQRRQSANDGRVSGRVTPSATVQLDTGAKLAPDAGDPLTVATPTGPDKGRFDIPPLRGKYAEDGSGSLTSTIINVKCVREVTTQSGDTYQEVVKPITKCEDPMQTDLSYAARPPYTVTMDVTVENTRDEDTGLTDDEADQLAEKSAETYVAGLRQMTAQLTSTMYHQVAIVGSFFDAWGQQDAQRTLQRMQAEAVKDYQPGKAMCRFGSLSSSQAGTDMKMRANKLALNDYMQGRELSQDGRNAAMFAFKAGQSRLRQFKQLHCFDEQNSRSGLSALCGNIAPTGRDYADSPDKRYNRDIDYTRLLATNNTLNFDMTDSELTADEEDIMALSRRLYAQETFSKLDGRAIGGPGQNYYPYMRVRSINAARSVARNSFTDYVARKAKGSGNAAGPHMRAMVKELGLSGDAANEYIGKNPSYHAQMDVLNKKIYQDPGFVTNLYDTPTNVTRQHVFMYARKLVQRREIYKSLKRREMMLASLLEMRLRDVQNEVNTRLPVVGQSLDVQEEDES